MNSSPVTLQLLLIFSSLSETIICGPTHLATDRTETNDTQSISVSQLLIHIHRIPFMMEFSGDSGVLQGYNVTGFGTMKQPRNQSYITLIVNLQ